MLRHACNTDLITLLMLPKTKSCRVLGPVYQSFITNYDGCAYYKLRDEVLLQIIWNYEKALTNCDRYSCITLDDKIITNYDNYYKLCQKRRAISFLLYFGCRIFPNFMVTRKVTAIGFLLYILTQPLCIFEFFVLCVIVCHSELFLSFDLSQNRMQNYGQKLTLYF